MTRFKDLVFVLGLISIFSLTHTKEDAALVQLVKKDYAAFLSGAAEAAAQVHCRQRPEHRK